MTFHSFKSAILVFRRRAGALLRERGGAVAVVMAIAAPVVVGVAGLGTEAVFWQMRQRSLQHQADVAAYSGAVDLWTGGRASSIDAAARQSLEAGGFRYDIGLATVETPPKAGPYAGDNAVVVSVQETYPRLISGLFLQADPVLHATATALVEGVGHVCVLALDTTASPAVAMGGGTQVHLKGCGVMSNSAAANSLAVDGSAVLEASCVGAVGVVVAASGIRLSDCETPRSRLPPIKDPYATVAEPAVSGACMTPNSFGGSPGTIHSITPGRYCGLTISREVKMAAGVYIVDGGDLRISSSAIVTGSGVTFYLTNGASVVINGGASVDLAAPASGSLSGILFFGRRSGASVDHLLSGSAGSRFNGAIYFPNDRLEMRGSNTTAAGCTQIVARTVDFRGNSGLGMDCSGSGVRDLRNTGGVRLVL